MRTVVLFSIVLSFICLSVVGQQERSAIEDKYKWDLTDIYSSDEAWKLAKDAFVEKAAKVKDFKGTITKSSDNLLKVLEYFSQIDKEGRKIYVYASLNLNSDTRNMKFAGMTKELQQIYSNFLTDAAYVDPEILQEDWGVIEGYIHKEPKLKPYEKMLKDLYRLNEHTLSEKEEEIIASTRMISNNAQSVYYTFTNAEMPNKDIVLENGEKVHLNASAYANYRADNNRNNRKLVFETYWKNYENFKASLGEMLYGHVKGDLFYSKVRNYESSLEASLFPKAIPVEVYHNHINNVNKNLPALHRYLKLKKRMMGIDTLQYFDLYASSVKDVDLNFTYDEAKDLILKSFQPLGSEYVEVVKKAFNENWIDVYPSEGKRSGAFSNDAFYDGHPFILLNYNGLYEDVATLAHELGHAMHSYLSNKSQPFPMASYEIFVAEVASTFNEVLLYDYFSKNINDEDVKLSFLMTRLDDFRTTFFRQTQFAEFELKIHQTAKEGIPLTGEKLSEIYTEIVNKYYGHNDGVSKVNDYINMEWAYIPHFYYNFYVYQYSTSFVASNALAARVLNNEEGAVDNYMKFLNAGGSDYPIELLKTAGVDLTKPDAFDLTINLMNDVMDEIELILEKKGL